jgi:hypothetical protein
MSGELALRNAEPPATSGLGMIPATVADAGEEAAYKLSSSRELRHRVSVHRSLDSTLGTKVASRSAEFFRAIASWCAIPEGRRRRRSADGAGRPPPGRTIWRALGNLYESKSAASREKRNEFRSTPRWFRRNGERAASEGLRREPVSNSDPIPTRIGTDTPHIRARSLFT